MVETVNLKYELESMVSDDFLNNSFTLPKSFVEMINKLHRVYAIDKYWAQQIIDENVEWDDVVYKDFYYAIKNEFHDFLNDIELEMNFHNLISNYFYKECFDGGIYLYGQFNVEVTASMSTRAYLAGADIDLSVHAKEYLKNNINEMIDNEYTELTNMAKRFN